jgi:hypothetical protein
MFLFMVYLMMSSVCYAIWWLVSSVLENVQKEAAMTEFKVLSQHLPGETEENHENLESE